MGSTSDEYQYDYLTEYVDGNNVKEKDVGSSDKLEIRGIHAFELNFTSGQLVLWTGPSDSSKLLTLSYYLKTN